MSITTNTLFSFLLSLVAAAVSGAAYVPPPTSSATNYVFPTDAASVLSFKSKADMDNRLLYALNERFDYCQWQGVKCAQGRVVRFVLQGFGLRGVFAPNTLTRLDQLRVLNLQNNSLSGPLPDLSLLVNLKSLFLSHNSFSGSFPPSILPLHRLTTLDISYNNLTGSIPVQLTGLARLNSLRLEFNQFNGTVPPLNQSFLVAFNVSGNNLTGPVPVTPTLSRFDTTAFSLNPSLCGEIINKACALRSPFFEQPNATSSQSPVGQSAQSQGGVVVLSPASRKKHKRNGVILGFTIGIALLITSILLVFALVKKQSNSTNTDERKSKEVLTVQSHENSRIQTRIAAQQNSETQQQEKASDNKIQFEETQKRATRSGNLVFCAGEAEVYTMEQLMRASAELLGRGTIATTYKAVLDNRLIATVKRLDANKTAITSSEVFEEHMDAVGGLRHPNLVPIRAHFQAKGERLIIYDYQPNGSLFNLIHGSRSSRAKPLHWTSCLKIAEDVAQGLAYIHQASKLVHGNLKSSNVLLGADFEACLTDYCLAILADSSSIEDPDSMAYKAPETRKSTRRATPKSDVYAFGVLLLELLTGRHPSQHPFLAPHDMLDWVRAMREDDGAENNRLGMLTEVASVCCVTSPEQRPAMWQVLRMIQEIKESVMVEDGGSFGCS